MKHPLQAAAALVTERDAAELGSDPDSAARPQRGEIEPIDRPKHPEARSKLGSDPNFTGHEVQAWLTVTGASLHNLQNVDAARPPPAPGRRHRRLRLRQVHAGARRAAGQRAGAGGAAHHQGRPRRDGRRASSPRWTGCERPDRLRDHRPRARSGPDAHRQDAAQLPGHLHRLLGHHPQAVCRHAGSQGAWLRGRALQLSTPARAAAPAAKGRASAPSP